MYYAFPLNNIYLKLWIDLKYVSVFWILILENCIIMYHWTGCKYIQGL